MEKGSPTSSQGHAFVLNTRLHPRETPVARQMEELPRGNRLWNSSTNSNAWRLHRMLYDDYEKFLTWVESVSAREFDWFVTLTVPFASCEADTDQAFDEWIAAIENKDGATKWARVAEKGDGNSFQLHVLIGGRNQTRRAKWMRAWEESTGGEAHSRRPRNTEELRGLLRYLVVRRECGFRSKSPWGPNVSFRGLNE
jgi:hypothetical protein